MVSQTPAHFHGWNLEGFGDCFIAQYELTFPLREGMTAVGYQKLPELVLP
jgi:hypothetical protein